MTPSSSLTFASNSFSAFLCCRKSDGFTLLLSFLLRRFGSLFSDLRLSMSLSLFLNFQLEELDLLVLVSLLLLQGLDRPRGAHHPQFEGPTIWNLTLRGRNCGTWFWTRSPGLCWPRAPCPLRYLGLFWMYGIGGCISMLSASSSGACSADFFWFEKLRRNDAWVGFSYCLLAESDLSLLESFLSELLVKLCLRFSFLLSTEPLIWGILDCRLFLTLGESIFARLMLLKWWLSRYDCLSGLYVFLSLRIAPCMSFNASSSILFSCSKSRKKRSSSSGSSSELLFSSILDSFEFGLIKNYDPNSFHLKWLYKLIIFLKCELALRVWHVRTRYSFSFTHFFNF